jgi:hypothetical protein
VQSRGVWVRFRTAISGVDVAVQRMAVITLVTITVLPESARNGHSRDSGVLPSCSNSGRSPQLDIGYLLWALDTQNLGV